MAYCATGMKTRLRLLLLAAFLIGVYAIGKMTGFTHELTVDGIRESMRQAGVAGFFVFVATLYDVGFNHFFKGDDPHGNVCFYLVRQFGYHITGDCRFKMNQDNSDGLGMLIFDQFINFIGRQG